MMRLAHFYHWSLDEIRRMSMFEINQAIFFMNAENKREAKRNGN